MGWEVQGWEKGRACPEVTYEELSRSGEIGRHTTFRVLCLNWHGGLEAPFGTQYYEENISSQERRACIFVFLRTMELKVKLTLMQKVHI